MSHNTEVIEIIDKYGKEYILRQLAEECAELAQASLKLVRSMKGETPISQEEANSRFLEEIADVCVMLECIKDGMLCNHEICIIAETSENKMKRMIERLLSRPNRNELEED